MKVEKILFWVLAIPIILLVGMLCPFVLHVAGYAAAKYVYEQIFNERL